LGAATLAGTGAGNAAGAAAGASPKLAANEPSATGASAAGAADRLILCQRDRIGRSRGQFAIGGNRDNRFGLGGGFSGQLLLIRAGVERQLGRHAAIAAHRNADHPGHPQAAIFRPGLGGPVADPSVQLVGRNVLGGHHPGFAPAPVERKGIGQVLAQLGGVLSAAQTVRQDRHAAVGFTGQGIGQAQVRRRNGIAPVIEDRHGLAVVARADVGQREAERGARGIVSQLHRIVERLGRRFEPSGAQIGLAQQRAVTGFAGVGRNQRLAHRDRLFGVTPRNRLLHIGGDPVGRRLGNDRTGRKAGSGHDGDGHHPGQAQRQLRAHRGLGAALAGQQRGPRDAKGLGRTWPPPLPY
jgi:hypothetical protein